MINKHSSKTAWRCESQWWRFILAFVWVKKKRFAFMSYLRSEHKTPLKMGDTRIRGGFFVRKILKLHSKILQHKIISPSESQTLGQRHEQRSPIVGIVVLEKGEYWLWDMITSHSKILSSVQCIQNLKWLTLLSSLSFRRINSIINLLTVMGQLSSLSRKRDMLSRIHCTVAWMLG